jgi:hypothetical protein
MSSIKSIISCFILLLITYSYSLPVEPKDEISKPFLEFTTGTTIVDNENKINMRLVPDEETSSVPDIHDKRDVEESPNEPVQVKQDGEEYKRDVEESKKDVEEPTSEPVKDEREIEESTGEPNIRDERDVDDSDEHTTSSGSEHRDDQTRSLLMDKDVIDTSSPITFSSELSLKDKTDDKHAVDDYLFTTMDTKTIFNARAMNLEKDEPEVESSTSLKRDIIQNDLEITTIRPIEEEKEKRYVNYRTKDISHTSLSSSKIRGVGVNTIRI